MHCCGKELDLFLKKETTSRAAVFFQNSFKHEHKFTCMWIYTPSFSVFLSCRGQTSAVTQQKVNAGVTGKVEHLLYGSHFIALLFISAKCFFTNAGRQYSKMSIYNLFNQLNSITFQVKYVFCCYLRKRALDGMADGYLTFKRAHSELSGLLIVF